MCHLVGGPVHITKIIHFNGIEQVTALKHEHPSNTQDKSFPNDVTSVRNSNNSVVIGKLRHR